MSQVAKAWSGPTHSFSITLPLPNNRANQSRGIAGYEGFYKKRYMKQCAGALTLLKSELLKMGYQVPVKKATWDAHFCVARRYDADNLAALCKWPLDALVQGGVLVDDGPDHLWPIAWPTQRTADNAHPRGVVVWLWVDRSVEGN